MAGANNLFTTLDGIETVLRHPEGWVQIGVIIVAGLAAWLVSHILRGRLEQLRPTEQGLTRLTLGGGERLLFPFVFLLLVLAGQAVVRRLDFNDDLLSIAAPLLISLAAIRLCVYLLRKSFSPGPALKASESTLTLLIWAVVALHLFGWLTPLIAALDEIAITLGTTRISVWSVLTLVFSIAVFLIIALWLAALVESRIQKSPFLSSSLKVGLGKTARLVLITLALLFALNTIGIDLTALAVFGGALGVGLGFGLQRIASNFISGFILLFDRSIKPGDVITVGDKYGWITALKARYVVVRDRTGAEHLIPNENIITSEVTNWTYSDRHIQIKLPAQISYDNDPQQAMALMEEAARKCPRVLTDPAPVARLLEFADNGIQLELRIWLPDPEEGVGDARTEINLNIWHAFKQHNIGIPYPQREVRMLSPNKQ